MAMFNSEVRLPEGHMKYRIPKDVFLQQDCRYLFHLKDPRRLVVKHPKLHRGGPREIVSQVGSPVWYYDGYNQE